MAEAPVRLDGAGLTIAALVRVAQGAPGVLAPEGLERMHAARAVIDRAVAEGRAVYGVTTGLGARATEVLDRDSLAAFSLQTLRGRAQAIGPPEPAARTRAGLAVRLNTLLTGHSGASPQVALHIAACLNAGLIPVTAEIGSVGPSDLVVNATAEQLRVSAQALADRMPEEATLFIFFSGTGVNIDGKDYFVGVDATMATDSSRMLAKSELFQMFISRGARIFFFSQASRPVDGGRYFGWESLLVGAIAESHGTMPNGQVLGSMSGDKIHGLYGRALSAVLHDLRTNTVPINEFGWLVFNKMRGGDGGLQGVGSRQVPTLPVLQNLTDKSPF